MTTEAPPTTTPLIRGINLRKTYRLGRVDVPVLHGASIDVNEGEWVAILGSSGSGKSTLLHLLGGLDHPDNEGGQVYFQGQEVLLNDGGETNQYRNSSIGFVFQFYHLLPELDVLENAMLTTLVTRRLGTRLVALFLALAGAGVGAWIGSMAVLSWGLLPLTEQTQFRASMLGIACAILGGATMIALTQVALAATVRTKTSTGHTADVTRKTVTDFGLSNRFRHRPRELSGGERQRVAIARALGSDPKVLLADEPTGNLDAATGREILDLLKERHQRGLTIVMVTHDPAVAGYADRIVRLDDGKIQEETQEDTSSRSSYASHA